MLETAKTLSALIANAKLSTLDRQTHEVQPAALAPVLVGFFAGRRTSSRVAARTYHFIDVVHLGYGRTIVNCVWVAALTLAVAAGATAVDRRPARRAAG